MRRSLVFFLTVLFLLPCSFVSAYDGYIEDAPMEQSSGDSMVTPASQSADKEISIETVKALYDEWFGDVSTSDCYEAFEEWGFVPDQRVVEYAVFMTSAWALTTYDVDFDYDYVTVGQTADGSAVSITQDSSGTVEVRFDVDFLREYELNGSRGEVLDSVIDGYKDAATDAVKEAFALLYDEGNGTTPVENTVLSRLIVPEGEVSTGACLPSEYLPDKFVQELQLKAAAFSLENEFYRLEMESEEYYQGGSNPYRGLSDTFASFMDSVNYSYVDLSSLNISSGVAFNTALGNLAIDPTYAIEMTQAFHNGYAFESVDSYKSGLYSAFATAVTLSSSGDGSVDKEDE